MKNPPPVTKNPKSKAILKKEFPDYIHKQLERWLTQTLLQQGYLRDTQDEYYNYYKSLTNELHNYFCTKLKLKCPQAWDEFLKFTFERNSRIYEVLLVVLGLANVNQAEKLEEILKINNLDYRVSLGDGMHKFKLEARVPSIIEKQTKIALSDNELLNEAWEKCYNTKNPDYSGVVRDCCSFLESHLGELYFPKDKKPSITRFIYDFENNPDSLNYKGSTIVEPKSTLTSLLKNVADIRGDHTGDRGNGRYPTKEEAEFVLHTTIYIWNLHYGTS